jgi:hypothetical protein
MIDLVRMMKEFNINKIKFKFIHGKICVFISNGMRETTITLTFIGLLCANNDRVLILIEH